MEKTLRKNLNANLLHQQFIEFVLVDFSSDDGLMEWVTTNFSAEIISGYLKYFYTTAMSGWECAMAKNTAHRLAKGEILVNLDCDNYTGANGGLFVIRQFEKFGPKIVTHQASGTPRDGSYGRIAMLRKYFITLAGYDQSFEPMGFQDFDLIRRAVELGLIHICLPDRRYNRAIANSKTVSIANSFSTLSYDEMLNRNISKSNYNFYRSKIVAAQPTIGITRNIYQFDGYKMIAL